MAVPYFRLELQDTEIEAVVNVLKSGWLTTGPECMAFEREFAQVIGPSTHAIAVNSNTSGMHLALEAANVGAGDEVIVPDLTFTATAEVARYLGAEVVFVDVLPDTLCMNPQEVLRAITPKTKALIPVHFGGMGAPLAELKEIANPRGIVIIEDAAHSFPSTIEERMIGSHGTFAAVFSFYANKTITTGEGGMIVTSDEGVAHRCRTMRLHGIDKDAFRRFQGDSAGWQYDIVAPGFKYNLPDMAAALGRRQLARAFEMRDSRALIAEAYNKGLDGLPLELPPEALAGDLHAWHLYPVRLTEDAAIDRTKLESVLAKSDIGYSVHYTPLHRMTYWKERYGLSDNQFPVATSYFERCLSLPIFSSMRASEAQEVISVIQEAFR
jgi:dTDP-4-amino-4,6-dideoxygalactose transaminase